jgi:hypothetical protein
MRRLPLFLLLGTVLALAGCGGDESEVPASFAPLHYEYLTKLRLNVADVEVQDRAPKGGDNDVSEQSPTPPAVALARMAHDRLFAAGSSGRALFVLDDANIRQGPDGALDGRLAVHMDILSNGGTRAGYAEAAVTRQHVPGSDPEDQRSVLYDMTKQMMDAMNVELEFQLRRSLREWLVSDAATPAPVATAPLEPATPVPSEPLPPPSQAAPPAEMPPDPGAPEMPQQMSPPPGFLQAPAGPPL